MPETSWNTPNTERTNEWTAWMIWMCTRWRPYNPVHGWATYFQALRIPNPIGGWLLGFTMVLPKCQSCSKRKHDISLHSLHKSNANLWKNPCQSGDRPGNWHCFLPITAATRFSKQVDDGWHLRQRPQDRWRGTQQLKNICLKGKTQSPKCHCLNMFETSFSPWSPLH